MQALWGQERFAGLYGVATDPSGAVLPNVAVTITNKGTERVFTTKTGGDGSYFARDLEPGRYSIKFELAGFAAYEIPQVSLLLGKTGKVDANMQVGTAQQSVQVTEQAALIDTSSTMVAHNVTAEEFDNLPKGRTYQGLAAFSPSVNTGNIEGGYQINGASGAENNYYIDGVSTNSQIDGSARQSAAFEYLQEVQVKTTGLEAEYGGALGGVVTAVTKSGGNSFHGEAHYYYYGNALNASPVQRLQIDPQTQGSASYIQDPKQVSNNHEFGGTISGPILRNKLYFLSSISPQYIRRSNNYLAGNGTTPYTGTANGYSQNWFNKLSWDPMNRVRTNFTYLNTTQRSTGSLPAFSGLGPGWTISPASTLLGGATRGFHQPESSYTGNVDITTSPTSLLSIKGGRYYLDYKEIGIPYTFQTWFRTSSVGMAGVPLPLQQLSGYVTPSAGQVLWDITTRTYVLADFSKYAHFLGTHNFKAGVGTTKNVNNVNNTVDGVNGRVQVYWGGTCASCPKTSPTGKYGYYFVEDYSIKGTTGAHINDFYLQDAWKIHSRLTLNLGLRDEQESIPTFRRDIRENAFQFGWGSKLSPRLGAALDVLGNGKLKVSGGWGRFFDWTKYDLARGTFGAEIWHTYYRTLDTTDVLGINLKNMPGQNIWGSAFKDSRIPGFNTVDPNIKPMSVDNMNAGAEYEVRPGTVVSARWTRSKLNRTIEDIGILDSTGSEAYLFGNPGESIFKYGLVSGATCSVKDTYGNCSYLMPKAVRIYNAMELSLTRRFATGWFASASYVYSNLWGNYPGLQNTDEIRPPGYSSYGANQGFTSTYYRPGGNATRAFDLDEIVFDSHGNAGVFGNLPTDRPHVVKLYGSKQFKFGTEIGAFFRVMSGTPVSTEVATVNDIPMYVEGRGNLGRTPVFSQTDIMVAHELKFGEIKRLRFEFNATNLFNQKTSMYTFPYYNNELNYSSTGINLSSVDLTKGFDWKTMVSKVPTTATNPVLDPRYNRAAWFNAGFAGRVMVKFVF